MSSRIDSSTANDAALSHEPRTTLSSRRRLLRWSATGGAIAAGAMLTSGVRLGAAAAQQGDPLVGSWLVNISNADGSTDVEVVSFTSDGILIGTSSPYSPPDPTQGPDATASYNSTGQGAWISKGSGAYHFTFMQIAYDTSGMVMGTVAISGSIKIAADGMSFSAGFGITAKDAGGNVQFSAPEPQAGSVQGTRISA